MSLSLNIKTLWFCQSNSLKRNIFIDIAWALKTQRCSSGSVSSSVQVISTAANLLRVTFQSANWKVDNIRLLKPDIILSTSTRISYTISDICSHSICEMLVGTGCQIPDRLRASILLCLYRSDITTIRDSSLCSSQVAMVNRLVSYLVSVTSNSTKCQQVPTRRRLTTTFV
jgi:hypothetical protein